MVGKDSNIKIKQEQNQMPDNLLIIGSKPIQNYAYSMLLMFETQKEIEISVNHDRSPIMERLISLFKVHGVEQLSRTKERYRIKVILARA